MENKSEVRLPGRIQGQMLRLGEHHAVAIYVRDGVMFVADFVDGRGTLIDANTWFRFNCGTLRNSHALRRMALESATPIPAELAERIEALHDVAGAGKQWNVERLAKACIRALGRGRLAKLLASRLRRRRLHLTHSARSIRRISAMNPTGDHYGNRQHNASLRQAQRERMAQDPGNRDDQGIVTDCTFD